MRQRKNGRTGFTAGLLGATLATGVLGFRTAHHPSSCCRCEPIPGGANERIFTETLPISAPPPVPVESQEWRVESPAQAAFSDLSTLHSPLSTLNWHGWPDALAPPAPNGRLLFDDLASPQPAALFPIAPRQPASEATGDPNAAALDALRAAAAGRLSIDDTGAAIPSPPPPAGPGGTPAAVPADPTRPLAALPMPGLPALLAAALLPLPAVLRRRGRRLAAALTERASSVLGLLLIIAWGALLRRQR